MSLIKHPHELSVQVKIKCLIYGQIGTGKTTLATSAPRPVLLDYDGSTHRVNYGHLCDTVPIQSWEDTQQFLKSDLTGYETVIVDTAGKMLDYMDADIIRRNAKFARATGQLTMQGYQERKGMFRKFCGELMLLGKHVIFVAHRETQRNGDEIRYVPRFGGSAYDDLGSELDLVGYLECVGRKRTITFDPTDRNDGKNSCNLPAIMELPIVVDDSDNPLPNLFMQTHVIAPYIARLERRVAHGKAYETTIGFIKENVDAIVDAETANEVVAKVPHFEHVGNSIEVTRKLITAKCTQLGLKFNKETKEYEGAV
jgi:hypothetical protein